MPNRYEMPATCHKSNMIDEQPINKPKLHKLIGDSEIVAGKRMRISDAKCFQGCEMSHDDR